MNNRHRKKDRLTDRQTDGWMIDGTTDRQIDGWMAGQNDRRMEHETTDRQTDDHYHIGLGSMTQ